MSYYYYAILDTNGEFTPSENKLGISLPLAESYQLERSASREVEIDSMIADFEQELEQNYPEYFTFSLHSSAVQRMAYETLLRWERLMLFALEMEAELAEFM
ncbi:MAG: hypothetical protein ACE5GL_11720 [Calditrichia bacterium]